MNMRFRAVASIALTLALSSGYANSSCNENKKPPSSPQKGKPKPPATAKPGGPEQGKPFPGSVRLTFWVTADHEVDVIYSIGSAHKSHSCERSCHWDDTGKPEQTIRVVVGPKDKRTEAGRAIEVVQANNGRVACKGDNYDKDPIDPATCEGKIVI